MADMVHIEVSSEVRVSVEKKAKAFMVERGHKLEQFNQDCNAVVGMRVLKDLGVGFPEIPELPEKPTDEQKKEHAEAVANKHQILQALKVLGNSSALRQKISGVATPAAKAGSEEKVKELMGLVED